MLSQFPSWSKTREKSHQSCAFFCSFMLMCVCVGGGFQHYNNFLCFWKVPSHKQTGKVHGILRESSSWDSPRGTAQWGTIHLFKEVLDFVLRSKSDPWDVWASQLFSLRALVFCFHLFTQLAGFKIKCFLPARAPDMDKSLYTYITHSSLVLKRNLLSSWSLKNCVLRTMIGHSSQKRIFLFYMIPTNWPKQTVILQKKTPFFTFGSPLILNLLLRLSGCQSRLCGSSSLR